MNIIAQLEAEQRAKIDEKRSLPAFNAGDTVRVSVRVTEGTRTRIQIFEGVCIGRSGGGLHETFTVRKMSYGEGVERVFPCYSPLVEGVELVRRGRVRRAKLYYLRGLTGKAARIAEKKDNRKKADKRVAAKADAAPKAKAAAAEAESAKKAAGAE